jgi:hypothetical protein
VVALLREDDEGVGLPRSRCAKSAQGTSLTMEDSLLEGDKGRGALTPPEKEGGGVSCRGEEISLPEEPIPPWLRSPPSGSRRQQPAPVNSPEIIAFN